MIGSFGWKLIFHATSMARELIGKLQLSHVPDVYILVSGSSCQHRVLLRPANPEQVLLKVVRRTAKYTQATITPSCEGSHVPHTDRVIHAVARQEVPILGDIPM